MATHRGAGEAINIVIVRNSIDKTTGSLYGRLQCSAEAKVYVCNQYVCDEFPKFTRGLRFNDRKVKSYHKAGRRRYAYPGPLIRSFKYGVNLECDIKSKRP